MHPRRIVVCCDGESDHFDTVRVAVLVLFGIFVDRCVIQTWFLFTLTLILLKLTVTWDTNDGRSCL